MSPFRLSGGSQDIMTLVFDAGIAFISSGAEGTIKNECFKTTINKNIIYNNIPSSCVRQKSEDVFTPSPTFVYASTQTV